MPTVARTILTALLLVGCQPAADPTPESPGERDRPPPEGGEDACDDRTAERIDEVVEEQLAAFAAGDFEAAWTYASEEFRNAIDVDDLREIIEEGFPVVREASSHELGHCEHRNDAASAFVAVTGASGDTQMLAYELVFERGEWRISGAFPVEDDPEEEGITV